MVSATRRRTRRPSGSALADPPMSTLTPVSARVVTRASAAWTSATPTGKSISVCATESVTPRT
eukprot:11829265-Heterocapsa_arctica.AAC.1